VTGTVSGDMTMAPASARRLRTAIAFWSLAAVALLGSHDAVFLAQLGPGEGLVGALRTAGHGYWGAASLVLGVLGAGAAIASIVRLAMLRRRASRLGARNAGARTRLGHRLVLTWGRLFAIVAIGFVVQESGEHLAMHSHAIGLGALIGPEYPLALPVIALITLVAAVVATLVAGTEAAILDMIAAALAPERTRAPRTLRRPPVALVLPRLSPLARSAAGRAPPLGSASAG